MTSEERNKEIEWLMGSLKRSVATGKSTIIWTLLLSVVFIALGIVFSFILNDDHDIAPFMFFGLGGILLIFAFINNYYNKKMANAETPEELLAAHDRLWIIQSALILIGGLCLVFFKDGSLFNKACLVLSLAVIVFTGWQAMLGKLRLWVAISLLIVEAILLYFSGMGILMGLPLLIVMVTMIQGDRSLFAGSKEGDGLDEEDEKDIKYLRELVKERKLH